MMKLKIFLILYLLIVIIGNSCRSKRIAYSGEAKLFYPERKGNVFFVGAKLYDSSQNELIVDSLFETSEDTLRVGEGISNYKGYSIIIGTSQSPNGKGFQYTYRIFVDSLVNKNEVIWFKPVLRYP